MTYADKYLKDGVDVEEFVIDTCSNIGTSNFNVVKREYDVMFWANDIKNFLRNEVKPTLTEDEKVILRNIEWKGNKPIEIGRDEDNDLEIKYIEKGIRYDCFPEYNHLFQFIKPRRRI